MGYLYLMNGSKINFFAMYNLVSLSKKYIRIFDLRICCFILFAFFSNHDFSNKNELYFSDLKKNKISLISKRVTWAIFRDFHWKNAVN